MTAVATRPVSRQRRWQIKQRALGRCMECGIPESVVKGFCDKHRRQRNAKAIAGTTPRDHCSRCGRLGHHQQTCLELEVKVAAE